MFPELSEIKKRRARLSLTQKRLAQLADVSQSMIAKIESGAIDPSYSFVKRVFEALEAFEHEENVRASDIMNLHVVSASPSEKLDEALRRMKSRNIDQMPVTEGERIVGSVSEDSVVGYLSGEGEKRDFRKLLVKDVMGDAFPTVREDAPYKLLLELLKYNKAVLILKAGKAAGIVTKADLLRVR